MREQTAASRPPQDEDLSLCDQSRPHAEEHPKGASRSTPTADASIVTLAAESLDRVLVPRVPALVAGFRDVLWLSPEGEIEALSPAEARARLDPIQGGETPMVCHARAVARRLDIAGVAAFDLLELFAFVRPARFCVPTPRGLAAALGLVPPRDMAEACVALATAARALLQELANEAIADVRAITEIAERAGWSWGPAVLAALPAADPGVHRRAPNPTGGLRAWERLDEWQERA